MLGLFCIRDDECDIFLVVAEFADIELPKESEERFHEIPMINQGEPLKEILVKLFLKCLSVCEGFIVQTMLYLMERVPHLADFCVVGYLN